MNRYVPAGGDEQGGGLAEAVVALLLLGLGTLSGLQLVALSIKSGDELQRKAASNSLLVGRLEERMALDWDDPSPDPGGSLDHPVSGYVEEVILDGRAWRLLCLVSPATAGRKRVTLRLIPVAGKAGARPGTSLSCWVVQ